MVKQIQPKYSKSFSSKGIWDYKLKSIDLSRPAIIKWYLGRKIEFNDWQAIDYYYLKKYLPTLDVDPAKKEILAKFINWYDYSQPSSNRVNKVHS